MSGFELVIFDCDGVVVDSEALACRCLADVLARHDAPVALADVFERFLGRSFAAVEGYYRAVKGRELPAPFRDELRAHLLTSFRASLKPMPHIRDVLGRLDLPFCLASSSDAERIRLTLEVAGLAASFGDRVYDAASVKRGKPAPDLFLFAAAEMSARPERTLVVEDSVPGIEAGKAAGMTVWGFTGGSHYAGRRDAESRLLTAGADRVFSSMAEFLAPETAAPATVAR